jgi:hypothetical protein
MRARAKDYQSAGDLAKRRPIWTRRRRSRPRGRIYLARGMFFAETNRAERAIHDLTLAINLNLERTEIYTARVKRTPRCASTIKR